MVHIPADNANSFAQYPLAQMVKAPLAGQLIGLQGSHFVIAEWTASGVSEEPPLPIAPFHVHYDDDEAWYILEGALAFRLGDQEVQAPAGAAVFAPRGVPHTYWNPDPVPARYLIVMTQNIRSLIDELHASPERDPATLQAIFQRHASALLQ